MAQTCTTLLCGGVAVMQQKYLIPWWKRQRKCARCYDPTRALGEWVPIKPPLEIDTQLAEALDRAHSNGVAEPKNIYIGRRQADALEAKLQDAGMEASGLFYEDDRRLEWNGRSVYLVNADNHFEAR